MPEVSIVKRPQTEVQRAAEPQALSSSSASSTTSTKAATTTNKAAATSSATTISATRSLETFTLDNDQTLTLASYPTLLTTKLPSSTTKSSTSSTLSTLDNSLYLAFNEKTSSSSSEKSLITVYTQLHATGSLVPSIEWIIPTITTNSLPSGYSGISSSNTSSYHCNYTSCQSQYSNSSQLSGWTYSSSLYPSSSVSVSSFIDPKLPKSSTSSKSSSKKSKLSSKTSSSRSTHHSSSVSLYSPLPTTTSLTTPTTSSSSLGTTTVTEYLEELTYTQVYIVTDSKLTLTTSLLATTSFYVDSMSATFSLSPPAITTDIAALKSRPDFDTIFKKKLSGGAIAGIAVGSILGFLFLLSFFLLYLRRKRKGGLSLVPFFAKDTESATSGHYDSTYVRDESPDDDDDDDADGFNMISRGPRFSPALPLENDGKPTPKAPPVPNRSSKPTLQPPPHLYLNTHPLGSPLINSPQTPVQTPDTIHFTAHEDELNEDDLDLSLFDMKSTLSAINASTEVNHHLMPPIPPARKSLSSNRIDKMNYKVDKVTPSPSSQLPIDRTMGVLYESPNEQCVWDEFEGAKTSGVMSSSVSHDSPIDSVFGPFESEKTNYSKKKSHYLEQLHANTDFDDSFRSGILDSTRVRSGSGAKRYEYLANNVNIIKHELEKERLASPLSTSRPEMGGSDSSDGYFTGVVSINNTHNSTPGGKIPPPVPKPRKNTTSMS